MKLVPNISIDSILGEEQRSAYLSEWPAFSNAVTGDNLDRIQHSCLVWGYSLR